MVSKKVQEKEEINQEEKINSRYFYAVGRRKSAVAKIKLFADKSENKLTINGRTLEQYFPLSSQQDTAKAPLQLTGDNRFDIEVKAFGGGISAQAQAVRLGISRALVLFNETLKKSLKDRGYLTRDSREVERKKAGLKKARRAPQWAKR